MNNNKNQTSTNNHLNTCAVCNQTGGVGAKWLLYIEGSNTPRLVHRPCGETALQNAPEGVKGKVVPSRQLQEEWRSKRLARGFWDKAFAEAKPMVKASVVQATEPKPVLAVVATPLPMMVAKAA